MTTVIIQGRMFVEPLLCPGCPALCCYFPWVLFDSCPGGSAGKEPTCHCRRHKRHWFDPWVGKIPWRRKWQPAPVFLPRKFHGERSLAGYSPWGCKKSDTTGCVRTHTHTHTHTCKVLFKAGVPSFVWQVGKQRLREGNKLILQTRVTNSFNCEWENSGRILKSQRFYPEISPRTGPRLVISKLWTLFLQCPLPFGSLGRWQDPERPGSEVTLQRHCSWWQSAGEKAGCPELRPFRPWACYIPAGKGEACTHQGCLLISSWEQGGCPHTWCGRRFFLSLSFLPSLTYLQSTNDVLGTGDCGGAQDRESLPSRSLQSQRETDNENPNT